MDIRNPIKIKSPNIFTKYQFTINKNRNLHIMFICHPRSTYISAISEYNNVTGLIIVVIIFTLL